MHSTRTNETSNFEKTLPVTVKPSVQRESSLRGPRGNAGPYILA
jgi:hypothetical protein